MADKTICELSGFDSFPRSGVEPGVVEKLQEQDLFLVSKKMSSADRDFVTVKIQADKLSTDLYNVIYPKMKNTLSSSTDYDLKKLAHLDTLPGDLIDNGTVSLTEKVTGYRGLALSDEVDLGLPYLAGIYNSQYTTDLKLSALAHVDKISLSNSTGLSGKLPLISIDCEFGDLLTSTWKDLDLSALAHRNNITEAHIVGTLDFPTKIRNYTDTLDKRYLLSAASSTSLGGIKTGFFEPLHNTDKNYAVKLDNTSSKAYVHVPWTDTIFTLSAATLSDLGGIKTGYATRGHNYAVNLDLSGNAFVTVPWHDTTYSSGPGITVTKTKELSLDIATRTTLGGMKTGFFEPIHNTDKNYAVRLDPNSNAYVTVPWTDTTYSLPAATLTELGGVKTGYETKGRNYAVRLDSNSNAFVTVPWDNTDTTYTAGTGIKITGTTISLANPTPYTAGTGIKITGTTISLANPTPASSIKYSETSSFQFSGTVCYMSAHTKSVYSGGRYYTMHYDSWTAKNDCIVTVYVSLPMNISNCGTPCKREIYLQPSGGSATSIYTMAKPITCTMPLILKAGDTIQITGACGLAHGTTYQITGTYLNRS